ncbi:MULTISPECIES: DUF3071 domain-containing protein [Bradyrhizobium]|uniref:DUF3071 domain-containing protein n=1 Tax=Bradyrhizobium TaxID=374 RepID=UPI003A0FBB69
MEPTPVCAGLRGVARWGGAARIRLGAACPAVAALAAARVAGRCAAFAEPVLVERCRPAEAVSRLRVAPDSVHRAAAGFAACRLAACLADRFAPRAVHLSDVRHLAADRAVVDPVAAGPVAAALDLRVGHPAARRRLVLVVLVPAAAAAAHLGGPACPAVAVDRDGCSGRAGRSAAAVADPALSWGAIAAAAAAGWDAECG